METAVIRGISAPISRFCFGCEQLGGTDWGAVDESHSIAAVRHAVDAGINFFDTADVYGLGLSEERLAAALGPLRHEVVIATKIGVAWEPRPERARIYTDCRPAHIKSAVEHCLRRLRLEQLPLLQLHRYDDATPLEDTLGALVDLRAAGKVGAVGYSNFPVEALARAHALLPASTCQFPLNLLYHSQSAEAIEFCRAHAIGVLAYGVLAHGLLSGRYGRDSRFDLSDRRHRLSDFRGDVLEKNLETLAAVEVIAKRCGRPLTEIALQWVLGYPGVTSAIVGQKNVSQLQQNLRVFEWKLATDEWTELAGLRSAESTDGSAR